MIAKVVNIRSAGIGRGLVETFLLRPNSTVIASVRNSADANSKSLLSLPTGENSKVIVIQLDIVSESSAQEAVKTLQEKYEISKLDVVIVTAGISKYYGIVIETPPVEVVEHYQSNVVGTFIVFQATFSLLQMSEKPIFIVLSTGVASIGDMESFPMPNAAYGASKAALNFVVRKIHFENPWLIAFPLSPGYVVNSRAARRKRTILM